MAIAQHHGSSPEVFTITGARKSQQEDMHDRMVKYGISMSIRTACFLLGVFLPGPIRWVFFTGALVLPYVAVLIANAGRERPRSPMTTIGRPQRQPITQPMIQAASVQTAQDRADAERTAAEAARPPAA